MIIYGCLNLFHGPTLAFKDFAMQILGLLMDRALIKRGERATILGATSGDTGGAAIEAFRGREQIDIFILHPSWPCFRCSTAANDNSTGREMYLTLLLKARLMIAKLWSRLCLMIMNFEMA